MPSVDALPEPTDTNFLNKLPLMITINDSAFSNHPCIQYSQSQYELSKSREQLPEIYTGSVLLDNSCDLTTVLLLIKNLKPN
ncbi:MAG TPA: hypothetical protein VIM07_09645 [Chitinophagaceae bacterium]